MKQILFIFFLFSLSFSLTGQVLDGTSWLVYDTSGTFFRYFEFSNDSINFSQDSINYQSVSWYEEDSNQIRIVDKLLPGGCSITDTAIYDINMSNDTLNFDYVSDSCYARYLTMSLYTWVKNVPVTIGMNQNQDRITPIVYPNPAENYVRINLENGSTDQYVIVDQLGKIQWKGMLNKGINELNIEHFNPGVYFLKNTATTGKAQKFQKVR